MSQFYWGTIIPDVTSGSALANLMNQTGQAFLSNHIGGTRPSYAVQGTIWVDDDPAIMLRVKLFDGAEDVVIGHVTLDDHIFHVNVQAEDVTFVNAGTELSATDVQEALAQIDARLQLLEAP